MVENKDVFISYREVEKKEALWVKNNLENNGISCWMAPESIPGGSSYAEEIADAIDECKVLVVMVSPKAQKSKWIPSELEIAKNSNKVIIPFKIKKCDYVKAFKTYLIGLQWYDAYLNKNDAMEKMIIRIKEIIGKNTDDVVIDKDDKVSTTVLTTGDVSVTVPDVCASMLEMKLAYADALLEESNGNHKKALQMHRELADKGYAPSINFVGIAYVKGDFVEQDISLGVEYYRKSAELGYAPAQLNLGDCYMNGMGVETDKEEAVKWYIEAANNKDKPDGDAMFRLFLCYKFGKGVSADKNEAEKWHRLANENGITEYIDYYCR